MNYLKCSAPYLDAHIEGLKHNPLIKDKKCVEMLLEVIKEICKLEVQGDDELRSIWIEVPRGKISNFGDYKEYLKDESVSSYEEFVELWESYYPDENKWYMFSFTTYKNEHYLFFDSELIFHIPDLETFEDTDSPYIKLIRYRKKWFQDTATGFSLTKTESLTL